MAKCSFLARWQCIQLKTGVLVTNGEEKRYWETTGGLCHNYLSFYDWGKWTPTGMPESELRDHGGSADSNIGLQTPWVSLLLLLSHFSRVSVRPYRWQPTRLPGLWDFPGKNTGVGCQFFLQWVKVKVKVKLLSCVRLLATAGTAAHQAPSSMGFSRQEYWSGVPLPFPMY